MGNKIGKALYVKNALPFVNRTYVRAEEWVICDSGVDVSSADTNATTAVGCTTAARFWPVATFPLRAECWRVLP